MSKLKQEFLIQVRNSLFLFLYKNNGMSISDIGEIFSVDKSTVSRAVNKKDVEKGMLIKLLRFYYED